MLSSKYCTDQYSCNQNGNCINQQCLCKIGWKDKYCERPHCLYGHHNDK